MRFLRVFAASLVLGWLALSAPVLAAGETATGSQCNCWCTSKDGAKDARAAASHAACSTTCKEKGEKIIVCSRKASELPGNNLRCFENAAVCEANCAGPSLTAKQKANGYFYDEKYQPTECVTGTHYCYCTGSSYELAYKIPNPDPSKPPIGEITDLGSYVNIVYTYLLGISATVAIVMIMIGGIQYVTAVGTGNVKAAKTRIQNAVVGIVLLFSAALILQTVNPRLLTLQPPRLPAMKRIELLTDDNNCQVLADKGYQIQVEGRDHAKGAPAKACGVKGTVVKDAKGTAVAEGTVCTFRTCSDKTKSCFISGDKAECIACKEAVPTNETGLIPTSSVCAQLQKGMTPATDTDHPYCFWTRDPSMVLGLNGDTAVLAGAAFLSGGVALANPIAGAVVLGATLSSADVAKFRHGTCAELRVDCSKLPTTPLPGQGKFGLTCESYNTNNLKAVNTLTDNELNDLAPGWGDQDMKIVCEQDPCKMVRGGGKCLFVAERNECITTLLGQGGTGDSCDEDTDCISGICNTEGLNQCAPPGGNVDGEACAKDSQCKGGICNKEEEILNAIATSDVCRSPASLNDGQDCDRNTLCKSGSCVNTVCVGNKGSGSVCSQDHECSSGNCAGNVYGITEGNCE